MFIFGSKKKTDRGKFWEKEYNSFFNKQVEYLRKKKAAEDSLSDYQKKQLKDMKIIVIVFFPIFFAAGIWNILIGAIGGLIISAIFFLIMYRRNFRYSLVPALLWVITNVFLCIRLLFQYLIY